MKRLFLITLGLLFSLNISAQSSNELNSGSTYSAYASGLPLQLSSTNEKGMGIFGISYSNPASPSLSNPAFWSNSINSQVGVNFGFSNLSVSDSENSGMNSLLQIDSFQAIFPIKKNKLGFSVSLYPKTRTNYNVVSSQQVTANDGSEISLISNQIGTGGVTNFEMGLSFKVSRNFSLGFASGYSFLREKDTETLFLVGRSDATSSVINTQINGTSISNRFGVLFRANSIFSDRDRISLGSTLTLPMEFDSELNSDTEKIIDERAVDVSLISGQQGNISLPLEMGLGLTYYLNNNISFTAEGRLEKWEETDYDFSASEQDALKDRMQLGFGTSFIPKDYRRSTRLFSNFEYSLGVSYDTGHLEISNEEINTLWFSAGLGLLSQNLRSGSSFDLSLQYGLRGTTKNNLVKENIFGINLSVNLTELMFLQRKLN
jgi:hypothetical protein